MVPFSAGGYFDKIACFCFELQVLRAGRAGGDAGVSFYVDPAMLERPRDARRDRDHALLYHVPGRPARGGEDAGRAGAAQVRGGADRGGRTIEQ